MRKGRLLALASGLMLVLAGPAMAQVKQGDLDLKFSTQIEIDFEVRDNYSFNKDVNGINAREQFFVEQETRWWMDAKSGPFESRVMLEREDMWDTGNAEGDNDNDLTFEQAYAGYDFGWVKMRAGNQVFQLDPAELVYIDDDFGLRLWQNYDWGGWNFMWIFNIEGSELIGTGTGHESSKDRHFLMGNVDIKAAGWTVTPFVAYVIDKSETALSGKATETVEAFWLGGGAKGSVAGINVLAQFVYVTGEQELRPTTLPDLDIDAWAGFLSLAYPIPGTPLTIEFAGVWMSGDDDPTDTDAEGYQGIFQDVELLNPQGIWLDDDIVIAPKVAGAKQKCRGVFAAGPPPVPGCTGTFALTSDDDFSPNGSDFNFDAQGATSVFSTLSPTNPGNFGIQYYHGAIHYKATNELTLSFLFAYIKAMEDGLLGGDSHIGNEYTFHAVWRPHKYFRVTPTVSFLVPGDAIENLVGDDGTAFNFTLETMFLF